MGCTRLSSLALMNIHYGHAVIYDTAVELKSCMITHAHWSFFLCMGKMQPKVGSKVVLEEFKLCTYMYVIAHRNILHTHTHTHTHTHIHIHTHLHCSFCLLTYTPRSVIRVYTYTGTCITSQAPYVYMHHTVKAYTCVGGKMYSV